SLNVLKLDLPAAQLVTLELYGLNGQKIAALLDNKQCPAGITSFSLNKFTGARGCLIARLKSNETETTLPLVIK
ncbi:MAG: hypothetical protein PHC61_05055, partial [Chitinivibrionales bacterium]|nr:hypothetical protein [Chitinivibrionales bacterium]